MAYKLLYIEDQAAESRAKDLSNLGFEVVTYDPSSNIEDLLKLVTNDIDALIMDYRLTAGEKNACFDAPTIAQTLRSKYSHDEKKRLELPIILMSNESIITDYYNDFTSQDLFDFSITKKEFIDRQGRFGDKAISFIEGYRRIRESKFNILKILGLAGNEESLVHPNIFIKVNHFDKHVFEYSRLVFEQIIRSIGPLIGKDVLLARLGISSDSPDCIKLLSMLDGSKYTGILGDVYERWWSLKVNNWWLSNISDVPLRRLEALERVEYLKNKTGLNLNAITASKYSHSSNFWTICKHSHIPIDPFDGIELYKRDILPWQEKEYISMDSALIKMDLYKDYITDVDKKAVRELANQTNTK